MLRKKFLAIAMSAVLAVGLCPALAVAAPLTGGSGDLSAQSAPAKSAKTTQKKAKKKTVYVLTGYAYVYSDGSTSTYDNAFEYSKATGLLTKSGEYKFGYKGINLSKITDVYSGGSSSYTVKSSNGLPKKGTKTYKNSGKVSSKYEYTYVRNAKGNLTALKAKHSSKSYYYKTFKKLKKTYSSTTGYTWKRGKIAKSVTNWNAIDKSSGIEAPYTYSWDGKGNLKKCSQAYSSYSTTTYQYSGYKNGHPTKRTATTKYYYSSTPSKSTMTLTYEKRTVPAKYVPVVKAQQWALLNGNLNAAFGPVNPSLSGDVARY